jgi:hypothetical protein
MDVVGCGGKAAVPERQWGDRWEWEDGMAGQDPQSYKDRIEISRFGYGCMISSLGPTQIDRLLWLSHGKTVSARPFFDRNVFPVTVTKQQLP